MTGIAQRIRLHLPPCGPGSESQALNLCYYIVKLCTIFIVEKRTKINKNSKNGVWHLTLMGKVGYLYTGEHIEGYLPMS